ncbi:G-protein coupled receptor 151-like [Acipenser ruthenus]|uniref:G-protein coupled receptor 151-like n=1 Tax=Acipenser ruthenus TaxID=7906 RepID=UPI00145B1C90|nr:G-protein coupled receptor 151-like [Acipenser ruthenus]
MEKLAIRVSNFSTTNSSTDKQRYFAGGHQHLDSKEWKVLLPAVLSVICVLGSAGNLTVIGVLISSARKGKPSLINSLILNLSIADVLILAFAVPFKAAAYAKASWTLGWFVCKTSDWFIQSCMAAKSFTITILAKACFMYVSNPTKQINIKNKTILAVMLTSWILACILPLPAWLFATLKHEGSGLVCVQAIPLSAQDFMSVYVKLYPFVIFWAPLSFAFIYVWRSYGRCQRRGTKTQNLRTQIRSRKLTVMLLSTTATFTLMWLPEWVSWVWVNHIMENGPAPPLFFVISAQVIMFAISLLNPLIILSMSEEFREGYKGLGTRLILKKQKPDSEPQETQVENSSAEAPPNSDHSQDEQTKFNQNQQQEEPSSSKENPDSPINKDIILPDVEQFWHEREAESTTQENDPIPWENQDPKIQQPK